MTGRYGHGPNILTTEFYCFKYSSIQLVRIETSQNNAMKYSPNENVLVLWSDSMSITKIIQNFWNTDW